MPYDYTRGRALSKGLTIDRLAHFIKHLPARHALFIVDACAASKATLQVTENHNPSPLSFHARALHLITAGCVGTPLQLCQPGGSGPQTSVFVQVLLEGLRGGAFSKDNTWLTTPLLAAWVQRTVAERTSYTSFPAFFRLGPGDGAMFFYR